MNSIKLPISVIIPNYNSGQYLIECINSIIDEYYAVPREIIIVDDCSSDGSLAVAKLLKDKYPDVIKLIELSENSGAAFARLRGLRESTQELISCPDADDMLSPGALEKAYLKLDNHDMVIVEFYKIYDNNTIEKQIDLSCIDFPLSGREACKLTFGKWLIHEKGIFKKSHFIQAYSKVESLDFYNADEMITRNLIYFAKSIQHCSDAKYFYRVHSNQTTKSNKLNVLHHLKSEMALYSFLNCNRYFEENVILKAKLQNQIVGKAFHLMRMGGLEKNDVDKVKLYLREFNHLLPLKFWPFQEPRLFIVMIQSVLKQNLFYIMSNKLR